MTESRTVFLLGPSMVFFTETSDARAMAGLQRDAMERLAPGVSWRCESHLLFPGEAMARRGAALVEAGRPDAVVLVLSAFQFAYESVVLRVKERWPRLYPLANSLMERTRGMGTTAGPSWGRFLFRHLRQMALRTIGGSCDMSPDQWLASVTATLDGLARFEDMAVVCRLPLFYWDVPRTHLAFSEARMNQVRTALLEYCRARHITTYDVKAELDAAGRKIGVAADGLHFDPETRSFEAEVIARCLLAGLVPG